MRATVVAWFRSGGREWTVLARAPRRPARGCTPIRLLRRRVRVPSPAIVVHISIAIPQSWTQQLAVAIPGIWIICPAVIEGDMCCVREHVIWRRGDWPVRASPLCSALRQKLIHFSVVISTAVASCCQREAWAPGAPLSPVARPRPIIQGPWALSCIILDTVRSIAKVKAQSRLWKSLAFTRSDPA